MMPDWLQIALWVVAVIIALRLCFNSVRIVPEQEVQLIEQFGKFSRLLEAGFHLIIPFVEKVAYKQNLKEEVIDVPPQICITQDNVQVSVDGVLYVKVVGNDLNNLMNPKGISLQHPETCSTA